MAKIILSADIHIHQHRSDIKRVHDGFECLHWIYESAIKNQCKTVIFAGDFIHHRFSLNVYTYGKAVEIVEKYTKKGINTIFLLGNHDMFYEKNWELHSLLPLRQWATVIDKPCKLTVEGTEIDFLPYTPTPSHYLDTEVFSKPAELLITHLSIAEATLNAKYNILSIEDDSKEKEVISSDAFKKWKKVLLGHYHYGQKISNNIEYIGSPMQLNFGEIDQEKHIILLDLETLEQDYIVNDISPKFYRVANVEDISNIKIENAYIEVENIEDIDSKFEVRKRLSSLGAREIEFINSSSVGESDKNTQKAINNIQNIFNDRKKLIETYVDNVDTESLEKDKLKNIGNEIVQSL
jgi:DNA repair exonuclease SbcCD nuclease subunit